MVILEEQEEYEQIAEAISEHYNVEFGEILEDMYKEFVNGETPLQNIEENEGE